MNIHQVNVSYVGEQDRCLLRINSLGGEEFRAWLTRRMTLKLLPHLGKTAREQLDSQFRQPAPSVPLVDQKHQLLENFQKEAAVYNGDFQTPFKEQPAALPLGEEPLLVTELTITPLAEGKLQLVMLERVASRQRDLQLVMDPALTQGLLRLLNQSLKVSGWLEAPQALPTTDAATVIPVRGEHELMEAAEASAKPRYLN